METDEKYLFIGLIILSILILPILAMMSWSLKDLVYVGVGILFTVCLAVLYTIVDKSMDILEKW